MGLLTDVFGNPERALQSYGSPRRRSIFDLDPNKEVKFPLPALQNQLAVIEAEIIAAYQRGIVSNENAIERVQHEGLGYYDTMLKTDLHLASVANRLIGGAANFPFRVMPGDMNSDASQRKADFIWEVLDSFDFYEFLRQLYHAKLKGFSLCEIIYNEGMYWHGEKKIGIERITRVDERYLTVGRGRQIRFVTNENPDGAVLPMRGKFIPMFCGPGPWGDGMLNYAYPAYWIKKQSLMFFVKYQERWGNPPLVGRHTGNDQDAVMDFLENLYSDTVASLPMGAQLDILQPARDYDFVPGLNYLDDQMSRLFTGADLAVGHAGGRGNMGASKIHAEGLDELQLSLALSGTHVINRFLIKPLIDMNFGLQEQYPYLILGDEETDDSNAYLERATKAMTAGIPISKREFYSKAGLAKPENDEDELASAPAAPFGGAFGNFQQAESSMTVSQSKNSPQQTATDLSNSRIGSTRRVQDRLSEFRQHITMRRRSSQSD